MRERDDLAFTFFVQCFDANHLRHYQVRPTYIVCTDDYSYGPLAASWLWFKR